MKWIFPKPDRKPLSDSKRRFHYEAREPRWHSQSEYTFVEVDNVFGEAGEFNWSAVKEYRILDWRAGTHLHAASICEAMEDNINSQAWVDVEKKPSWWREIIVWKPEWIDRRLDGEDVAAELNSKLLDKLQNLFYPPCGMCNGSKMIIETWNDVVDNKRGFCKPISVTAPCPECSEG